MTMRGTKTIPAVAERADFGPAYDGEDFVTLTFRVPKDTPATAGIWDLTPLNVALWIVYGRNHLKWQRARNA